MLKVLARETLSSRCFVQTIVRTVVWTNSNYRLHVASSSLIDKTKLSCYRRLPVNAGHYCSSSSNDSNTTDGSEKEGRKHSDVNIKVAVDDQQSQVETSEAEESRACHELSNREKRDFSHLKNLGAISLYDSRNVDKHRSVLLVDSVEKIDPKAPRSKNDVFNPEFVNRNPRNLEFLRLEVKDGGWETERTKRNYYNKVVLERSHQYVTAKLVHITGVNVLSASSSEFCIARHLYSTKDNSALINVGRVLARRCLQSGIRSVYFDPLHLKESHPLSLLQSVMGECGVSGSEAAHVAAPVPPYQRRQWSSPYGGAAPDPATTAPAGLVPTDDDLLAQTWRRGDRYYKSEEDLIVEATDHPAAPAAAATARQAKQKRK